MDLMLSLITLEVARISQHFQKGVTGHNMCLEAFAIFGRLKPSVTGSKPELNLLNLNVGVQFKVWQTAKPNLFCRFRFGSKVPKPAPN